MKSSTMNYKNKVSNYHHLPSIPFSTSTISKTTTMGHTLLCRYFVLSKWSNWQHIQKVQIITLYGMYGMCRMCISFISTKSLKPLVNLIRRRQYSLEHTTKHRIRKQVKQMAVTDPTCKNIAYCINQTTLEPSISQHVFSQKQQKCCLTQGRVPKFVQCEKIILDQRLQSWIFKMQ